MIRRNVVTIAIALIIILIGIIMISTVGFNKELRYKESQKIDIYINNEVEIGKIKEITDEVLGKQNLVQAVEIYKDMVTIRATSISEEDVGTIITKLKEVYTFDQTAEDTEIKNVPSTRIYDMFKDYIIPFVISGVIIVAYMAIRYYKKGIVSVILNTVLIPVLSESVLMSLIAITRIPVGMFTPSCVLLVYFASIMYVIYRVEKKPNVVKSKK